MKNTEFVYVKTIASERSFSKAAKKLGISQPALSTYINKLETQLGVLLFDRSVAPIEITEFGKNYLEYADSVIEASEKFESIVSDLSGLKTGEITIGSTSCFSTGFLPKVLSDFNRQYSGIKINVVEGKVSEVEERCLEGAVDMFLADANIDDELFDREILFEERILMAVPSNDEINKQLEGYAVPVDDIVKGNVNDKKYGEVDLNLLKHKKFIMLNEDQHIRRIVDNMFEMAGYEPDVVMKVPQTTTGLSMTIENIGISFVAESTVKYQNIGKQPCYYKVGTKEGSVRKMCVAHKKNRYVSNASRKFMEQLKLSLG